MTHIAVQSVASDGRLTVSVDLTPGDQYLRLIVNGKILSGPFVQTIFGWLYQHTDGAWGAPLGFGEASVAIQFQSIVGPTVVTVGKPPSTFGQVRLTPEQILGFLWAAGFRTEADLLRALSISAGESGFYPSARNWLPSSGFRPATDVIGVQGPSAAWNADHSQQGFSDRGLFQINAKVWARYTDAECDDPLAACLTLAKMVKMPTGWTPWGFGNPDTWYSPFVDGTKNGIGPLRPIVKAFLAGPHG